MFFVNEAIRLIVLVIIAEVRLVKCKGTAGPQTADSSTIGYLLVPNTFLDDTTKIFSLKLSCCNKQRATSNKAQGYPFILNPHKSLISKFKSS